MEVHEIEVPIEPAQDRKNRRLTQRLEHRSKVVHLQHDNAKALKRRVGNGSQCRPFGTLDIHLEDQVARHGSRFFLYPVIERDEFSGRFDP